MRSRTGGPFSVARASLVASVALPHRRAAGLFRDRSGSASDAQRQLAVVGCRAARIAGGGRAMSSPNQSLRPPSNPRPSSRGRASRRGSANEPFSTSSHTMGGFTRRQLDDLDLHHSGLDAVQHHLRSSPNAPRAPGSAAPARRTRISSKARAASVASTLSLRHGPSSSVEPRAVASPARGSPRYRAPGRPTPRPTGSSPVVVPRSPGRFEDDPSIERQRCQYHARVNSPISEVSAEAAATRPAP